MCHLVELFPGDQPRHESERNERDLLVEKWLTEKSDEIDGGDR